MAAFPVSAARSASGPYHGRTAIYCGRRRDAPPYRLVEPLAVDPEAEGGVGDEVDFFAVHGIVAVGELRGIVLRRHLVVVRRLEADALHLFLRDVLHAVGDGEASVGGTVDEVRRRAHVRAEVVGVRTLEHLQRVEPAAVAVLADELVHRRVLAEALHAGREDDQLAAVRHRHARAVHRLVAEPGGGELRRVEVHDALLESVLHVVHVFLLRELHRLGEAVAPFADEEAVRADLPAGRRRDGEAEEDRTLAVDKVLHRIVEQAADGRVVASHRLLHAAHGADHVARVDHAGAARAHEEVLRVVGHADHLVGDDLSGGDHEIVLRVHHELVHLHGEGFLPQSARDFLHGLGGDVAELHHVRAPVVHDHLLEGDVLEHRLPLRLAHGYVRAERGQDVHVHAAFGQEAVAEARDESGVRVEAREVGREDEDVAQLPCVEGRLERLRERGADFVVGQSRVGRGDLECLGHLFSP